MGIGPVGLAVAAGITIGIALVLGNFMLSGATRLSSELRPKHPSARRFAAVSLAALTAASAAAAYRTRGVTVCLIIGLGVVLAAASVRLRSPLAAPMTGKDRRFLPCVVVILTALWFGLQTGRWSEFPWQIPARDTAHYAQIADSMWRTGIETLVGPESRLAPEYFGLSPYHYFELWLSAALSQIWGVPTLPVTMMLTPAVLAAAVGLGFLALAEAHGGRAGTVAWATAALWCSPFLPARALETHLLREADVFVAWGSVLGHQKLLPLYVILLAATLFDYAGNRAAALIAASCAGVANFTAIPISITCSIIGIRAAAESQKPASRAAFLWPALVTLSIPLFYWVNRSPDPTSPTSSELLHDLVAGGVGTKLNIVIKSTIQLGVVYLPLLALVEPRTLRLQLKNYGRLLLAVLSIGLIGWLLLDRWANGVQFFTNSAVVLLNLVVIDGVMRSNGRRQVIASALVFAVTLASVPEALRRMKEPLRYGESLLGNLPLDAGQIGGFLVPPEILRHASSHERNLRVNAPEYLGFADLAAIPLTCPATSGVPVDPAMRKLINTTLACRGASEAGAAAHRPLTAAELVARYQLQFVITRNSSALPAGLEHFHPIVRDPISGDTIHIPQPAHFD